MPPLTTKLSKFIEYGPRTLPSAIKQEPDSLSDTFDFDYVVYQR